MNLKTSFWNEDQITVENAFEEFEGFDMRLDVGTMQATDLLALYLAVESKFIMKMATGHTRVFEVGRLVFRSYQLGIMMGS